MTVHAVRCYSPPEVDAHVACDATRGLVTHKWAVLCVGTQSRCPSDYHDGTLPALRTGRCGTVGGRLPSDADKSRPFKVRVLNKRAIICGPVWRQNTAFPQKLVGLAC